MVADFKNNVTRLLDAQRVTYQVHTYSPEIHSAVEVAQAIGLANEQVYKTLVALADSAQTNSKEKPMLVIIPGAGTLDLKALAKAAALKKVKMASHQQAEQLTGLQTGGISALALTTRPFRVYLDDRALALQTIAVSAGQRGAQVVLPVAELIRLTRAKPIHLHSE